MKCKKCGHTIPNGEIACPSCHIAVATMSQIKTAEDQARIELDAREEIEKRPKEEREVSVPPEPVEIRFDADVLKEVKDNNEMIDIPTPKEEEIKNTSSMQPVTPVEESVDAEEVKKALKQYGDDSPKGFHFFLPIIIGLIVVLVIVIGIIYGVKTLF